MKRFLILITSALLTGCVSTPEKLAEYEALGITEAHVTGKFSDTTFTVEEVNGKRVATLTHNNIWLPKVKFVRKTPIEKAP